MNNCLSSLFWPIVFSRYTQISIANSLKGVASWSNKFQNTNEGLVSGINIYYLLFFMFVQSWFFGDSLVDLSV